jgi:1,4-dihydroxy-2-naphthoate octaprenyltransferase
MEGLGVLFVVVLLGVLAICASALISAFQPIADLIIVALIAIVAITALVLFALSQSRD